LEHDLSADDAERFRVALAALCVDDADVPRIGSLLPVAVAPTTLQ